MRSSFVSCSRMSAQKKQNLIRNFPEPHQKVVVVVRLGAFVKFLYRSLSRSHPRALLRRRCFMRAKRRSTGKIRLTPGCAREWEGLLALEKRFSWKIVNITLGAGSPPPTFLSTNQFSAFSRLFRQNAKESQLQRNCERHQAENWETLVRRQVADSPHVVFSEFTTTMTKFHISKTKTLQHLWRFKWTYFAFMRFWLCSPNQF